MVYNLNVFSYNSYQTSNRVYILPPKEERLPSRERGLPPTRVNLAVTSFLRETLYDRNEKERKGLGAHLYEYKLVGKFFAWIGLAFMAKNNKDETIYVNKE